jgi:hypothetical protein
VQCRGYVWEYGKTEFPTSSESERRDIAGEADNP